MCGIVGYIGSNEATGIFGMTGVVHSLAIKIAIRLSNDVDMPRNLATNVRVE